MQVELPIGTVDLGHACVGCGNVATTQVELEAKTGIDLVLVSFNYVINTPAPVCARCRSRHRVWFWSLAFGLIGLIVAMVMVYALFFHATYGESGASFLVIPSLLILYWARNHLDGFVDKHVLHVYAKSLSKKRNAITFWFRDPNLARATQARSAGRTPEKPNWNLDVNAV